MSERYYAFVFDTIYYTLIAIVTFILYAQPTYFLRLYDWVRGKTPPGPFSLPIIGALGVDTMAPWKTLAEWGDKNGGLCSLFLGAEFTVVLTDKDVIREAMVNSAFDGRPLNMISRKIMKSKGLSFADGPFWTDQRRFAASTIKHLGGAPGRLEQDGSLQGAAAELIDFIRSKDGQPMDGRHLFDRVVTTAAVELIQDGVVSVHDDSFPRFIQSLHEIFIMNENVGMLNIIPWLQYLPPFNATRKVLERSYGELFKLTKKNIAKRRQADEMPLEPRDVLDAMIQQQKREDPKTTNFTDDQLETLLVEMTSGAVEDLVDVFHWVLVILLNYPDIQAKCQAHIDEIIDRSRCPSLRDRANLGYIDAVIWECIRFSNVVPFPFPRRTMKTIQFRGYTIPKDTFIITNGYAVGFNKEYWGDPHVFRPERFLNDEGKFIQSPLILAFGAGRRVCVGMAYAQLQLFMFTTTILQNFTLSPAEKAPPSFSDFHLGITLTPNDFNIKASPR